jgi:hypothetical protein
LKSSLAASAIRNAISLLPGRHDPAFAQTQSGRIQLVVATPSTLWRCAMGRDKKQMPEAVDARRHLSRCPKMLRALSFRPRHTYELPVGIVRHLKLPLEKRGEQRELLSPPISGKIGDP